MATVFRTVQPTAEPLTLAQAKAHLRVDIADDDTYITTLITVARVACEDRLQRTLLPTTWRLVADGFPAGSRRLPLSMGAVLSIVSVNYVDTSGTTQTMPAENYQLSLAGPQEALALAPGVSWPSTQTDRADALAVTYTAGMADTAEDLPAPIRHWLLLAIGDLYEQRMRSTEKPIVPQQFADGLLDVYRVLSV